MVKKVISVILCLSVLLTSFSIYGESLPFTDVKKSDWFYEPVKYAYENKIFSGTGEKEFSPNMAMTRGMFVTVLGRLAEIDTKGYNYESTFSDVNKGDYYNAYVNWAFEKGITSGVSKTEFAPNSNITREQMVCLLMRYLEVFEIDLNVEKSVKTTPKDINTASTWAKGYILDLWSYNLLNGDGVNFNPKNEAKRSEVAAFIQRMDKIVEWVKTPIIVEDTTEKPSHTPTHTQGNNSYNGTILDGVSKQEAKEIINEVKEDSAEKLAPQLNYTPDEQMIADYYTDENEERRLSLLEKHQSLTTIKTVSIDEESVRLEIKAPNLGLLILDNEIMNSELEGEEFSNLIQDILLEKLEKKQFEYKTFVIDVNYVVEDGEIVLEDSVEYANAIYGDLINVVQGMIDEDMDNLGEG